MTDTETETVKCARCGDELSKAEAIEANVEGTIEYHCSQECNDAVWKTVAYSSRSYR